MFVCKFISIISILIPVVEILNVNKINAAKSRNNLPISIIYCLKIIFIYVWKIYSLFSLQVYIVEIWCIQINDP